MSIVSLTLIQRYTCQYIAGFHFLILRAFHHLHHLFKMFFIFLSSANIIYIIEFYIYVFSWYEKCGGMCVFVWLIYCASTDQFICSALFCIDYCHFYIVFIYTLFKSDNCYSLSGKYSPFEIHTEYLKMYLTRNIRYIIIYLVNIRYIFFVSIVAVFSQWIVNSMHALICQTYFILWSYIKVLDRF